MKRWIFCLFLCLFSCNMSHPSLGPYSIGRDQTWYPLNFGNRAISINAFTNALVQEIAKIENVPMYIVDVNWTSLFQNLEERKYGGVFSAIPLDEINESKYSFSDPILLLGPVLVVSKKAKYTSLEEMHGKIVGLNQYTNSILIVQKYPSIVPLLYHNMHTALDDLVQGKIDGVLLANLDAQELIPTRYASQLKIATPPLTNEGIRVVTLKNKNKRLISHFNHGLKKIKNLSQYRSLRKEFNVN